MIEYSQHVQCQNKELGVPELHWQWNVDIAYETLMWFLDLLYIHCFNEDGPTGWAKSICFCPFRCTQRYWLKNNQNVFSNNVDIPWPLGIVRQQIHTIITTGKVHTLKVILYLYVCMIMYMRIREKSYVARMTHTS